MVILIFLIVNSTYFYGFAQGTDTLKTEDILSMSLADLMNIKVVTASKTRQAINEVAATVHVITEEQIKNRACFTLEEALSDLPGFQFRNILGFNSYLFLRGAPSQNNLILLMIDGVQVNELNSGGFYAGGQFILSGIEQIEVVYGPASALYGTNAVSGIINIITKKPEKKEGYVSLLGGSFNTWMADFNFTDTPSKDFGYSVSAQYKTSEKANLKGPHGDNNWTDEMENFENDLSFSARIKFKKFDAGVDYQEKRSSRTTNYKSVDDIYLDRNTLWDILFMNAYIKYSATLNKNWSLNSTAYYRNSTVKSNTVGEIIKAAGPLPGGQVGYFRPNQLVGIENQFTYNPVDKLLLTGGLIGEAEWLSDGYSLTYSSSQDTPPPTPSKPPILDNYLFSYYSLINYSFVPQFSFNGGIRHDFSSYYGQVFIPRTGLVLNTGKITAKAIYNMAFRSPRPWDYTYGTGNSGLNPEKMNSLELNLSCRINKSLDFGASVYNNTIKDKLTRETTEQVDRWINKDKINTTGFELYGNYFTDRFNLYVNYTYNDSRDQDDVIVPEISLHTANTGFTYSLDGFAINLRANYLGNRKNPGIIPATGEDEIGNALVFHGCLTYSGLKRFSFQLKANNILNKEYYHPSNRFKGRYRQAQRAVLLKVTYGFAGNSS